MSADLIEIMKEDIKRCVDAQNLNSGTYNLYQTLIAKYNRVFDDFGNDIPMVGKGWVNNENSNYKPELNAIKEKLELLIVINKEKDSLYDFKEMYEEDLNSLKNAIADSGNIETFEIAKQQLYKEVTAKYDAYIPNLKVGLYGYEETSRFYDQIEGDELLHDLSQIYYKMLTFKSLGYPSLKEVISQSAPLVQITNTNKNENENKIDITISFNDVRKEIENMSALPNDEIEEILNKISDLEKIVNSSDRKSKKWENAKGIVKWIAEKGVDVGIALLPLLLQIK